MGSATPSDFYSASWLILIGSGFFFFFFIRWWLKRSKIGTGFILLFDTCMSFSILAFFCYSIVHKTELVVRLLTNFASIIRWVCIINHDKNKILVSKVENYWEAILIFPRSNASNYLGFGMQFWIQKCPASNPLYQNLYKRSRNFNSQSALQNKNFEWLYLTFIWISMWTLWFCFFFSFETNQKKVQGRSKMGLLCWFLG